MQLLRYILFPISWIYALTVRMRNIAYDLKWFKSESGAVKSLVIGNIAVGGTGKTPHTIFIAKQLQERSKVAILSRGYGRKTKGFLQINRTTHWSESGDEPLMYTFRTKTSVAVCEDRLVGIAKLKSTTSPDLVILDDALQHRRLKGDMNIALVRADRLPCDDFYLPTGTLRDSRSRLQQVDAVIVTHSKQLKYNRAEIPNKLGITNEIPVFFSNILYGKPYLLNQSETSTDLEKNIYLVTGIAHPQPLVDQLKQVGCKVAHRAYRDHAAFTNADVDQWKKYMADHQVQMLVTTEKDAMRMIGLTGISSIHIVVVPIEIEIEEHALLMALISEKLDI